MLEDRSILVTSFFPTAPLALTPANLRLQKFKVERLETQDED